MSKFFIPGLNPEVRWVLKDDVAVAALTERLKAAISGGTLVEVPVEVYGASATLVIDGGKLEGFTIVDLGEPALDGPSYL